MRASGKIAINASLGAQVAVPGLAFRRRALRGKRLHLLSITLAHVTWVEGLPFHHRDPFDRLLVAQARHEVMTLV
jgi:PIN domain nuclease of toxin-antitoxin system